MARRSDELLAELLVAMSDDTTKKRLAEIRAEKDRPAAAAWEQIEAAREDLAAREASLAAREAAMRAALGLK